MVIFVFLAQELRLLYVMLIIFAQWSRLSQKGRKAAKTVGSGCIYSADNRNANYKLWQLLRVVSRKFRPIHRKVQQSKCIDPCVR